MKVVNEKICFKCNKLLSIDNFYKHKLMPDGHLNKCIQCTKIDVKSRRLNLERDEKWVEAEKKRHRDKYHRLKYGDKYKPNKKKKQETIKKYNQKYPEKALARKYTEIFLKKQKGFNLHHWSYNQNDWLDVIELSISEHHFLHRFIKYNQIKKIYETLDGVLLDTKKKHLTYYAECVKKYK